MAWDRIHPRLTTRSAWIDHTGELPVIGYRLIRLQVERLPGAHFLDRPTHLRPGPQGARPRQAAPLEEPASCLTPRSTDVSVLAANRRREQAGVNTPLM